MVNIILNEQNNTVEIDYSCAGKEQVIEVISIESAKQLILAIKNITLISGEAVCLEIKDINGFFTTIERW